MQSERRMVLSEQGEARRDAMLPALIGVMQTHHKRRRIRRNLAACGAVVLLVLGTLYFVASAGSSMPDATIQVAAAEPEVAPGARIICVETDPGIVDRYRAVPSNLVVMINDVELLETLQAVERPAGLVRMGETVFVTASVADQPTLEPDGPNSL